jgi:diacylglycerol kinase (ATP)
VKRGVLIYNPTAGQKDRLPGMQALIDAARADGLHLENCPTSEPMHATRLAAQAAADGMDVVAVCGGDGTIAEVAAALAGTGVPLAVLPGGTSNVLAIELGIPLSPEGARHLLLEGRPRTIRPGLANGRPFLLMAGFGLDARIMGHMNLRLKRLLGRGGIFFTVAPEFFNYEFPRLEVEIDGSRHEATFAIVCRASHYAGDWVAAPDASLDNDTFEVLLFHSRKRFDVLRLFLGMQRQDRSHLARPFARIIRGRNVTVRSREDYPVECQLDGDCVLETPVECRIGEQTVVVLAP